MKFTINKLIRFGHCDMAGIVFYPQYLMMCNEVVEDWFEQAHEVPLPQLINELHRGIPMRHIEADFILPAMCGDYLDFTLQVKRIGNSSFTLLIQAVDSDRKVRFKALQTLVWSDVNGPKPTAIPDDWRAKFNQYLLSDES